MKKYIVIILFTFISVVSFSQQINQAVVYFKNGSIIRGAIIEQIPDKSIKIKVDDTHILAFQMNEIEKITEEPIKIKEPRKKAYQGTVETGYAIGIGYYGENNLKFNIINSIKYGPYFSLGLGIGIRKYYYSYNEHYEKNFGILSYEIQIPFFLDFRTTFLNRKISPYLALGIGDSYAGFSILGHESFWGIILNSAFGASMRISDKSAILAGISCEMQNMELYNIYGDYNEYRKNLFSIGINIGISF